MQQDPIKQKAQVATDKIIMQQKKILESMESSKLQPKYVEKKEQ